MNIRTLIYLSHRLRHQKLGHISSSEELSLARKAMARLTPSPSSTLKIIEHGDGTWHVEGATADLSKTLVHLLAYLAALDHKDSNNILREFEQALDAILEGRDVKG